MRFSQAGVTLLEVILGVSILAVATVGLNQLADRWAEDTRNTVAAGQVRSFGEAVKSYIKYNYAAVQASATATAPVIIDVPTLIAAQKLPPGYQNSNAYGHSTCALVLEPAANRLQAMIVTEGGKVLGDPSLASVASVVGGSGGGVYSTDTANIRGALGGWQLASATYDNLGNNLGRKCDGTPGNVRVTAGRPLMALWFENGDVSSAFLARDAVPGRPELNAMNTPLVMNAVQPVGGACAVGGAMAQDGSGRIVSCQGGTWKLLGDGTCQATSADLNTLQQDGRCYNGVALPNSPAGGDWVFVEVFRHFNPGNFFVGQRVTGMTGAAIGRTWLRTQNSGTAGGGWTGWMQVTDPQVSIAAGGNVTAAGAVNATNMTAAGSINGASLNANGNVTAGQAVIATGNVTSQTGTISTPATVQGGFVFSTGDLQANGTTHSFAHAINHNGTTWNLSEDWAFMGLTSASAGNAEPQSGRGSAYLNDVFLRSRNQWVSQLNRNLVLRAGPSVPGGQSIAFCAANETLVAGSCYGIDTCSGNDWSGHGGFPQTNAWVCPSWFCNTTQAFATCMF